MIPIFAATADEAWRLAMRHVQADADRVDGRGGITDELLHVAIEIRNPAQRWVWSRSPAINPAFALVEVLWILGGRSDARLPTTWNSRLPHFSGSGSEFSGAYGRRLRRSLGFDQLSAACDALINNASSRQVVLQLWDGATDFPKDKGRPQHGDVPCNVVAMLKLRGGNLHWTQIMRSNDLILGFPYNVVQFSAMQEIVASWVGAKVGTYTHFADSLHVYAGPGQAVNDDENGVAEPEVADTFAIARSDFEPVVDSALRQLDELAAMGATSAQHGIAAYATDLPGVYRDAVLVAAADIARRQGAADAAERYADRIESATVRRLWRNWVKRVGIRRA